MKLPCRYFLLLISLFIGKLSHAQQQDVVFHLNSTLLSGKTILKIKHDFHDSYLWVLAKNNEVYRINTVTLAVDNYTPQFAAYNNLQFIDIAGRSADTVFIATQSNSLLRYKAGNLSLFNFPGDTLTSVGIDYTKRLNSNVKNGNPLLVGTTKGLYRYDMDANTASWDNSLANARVFEATYRRDMFTGTNNMSPDTITYYPADFASPQTLYSGYLWLNNTTFGANLKTAFYTPYGYAGDSYVYGADNFWGTEKGMTQINWNYSYNASYPYSHYLNNIPVNKITDLFGLTSFASADLQMDAFGVDPGLAKQNLLIGTDNGLYFSSSILNKYQMVNGKNIGLRDFALFHYDELGTVRVNDICVNNESITWPVCEDGVWVACDNGLFLIKPDYSGFLGGKNLDIVVFKNVSDTISSLKICSGTTATAMISSQDYSGSSFQWYKNGQELPNQSADSLAINSNGDYYAVLYDPCQNIHVCTSSN